MPREQWVGFIKDYDGGTLMEYVIHPKIPYADLVDMFKVGSDRAWGPSSIFLAAVLYVLVKHACVMQHSYTTLIAGNTYVYTRVVDMRAQQDRCMVCLLRVCAAGAT